MPSIRVSALSVFGAIVIACAVFPGVNRTAFCCPVRQPIPLRQLYNHSDRIVVGRWGTSRVIKTVDEDLLLRTALHVSTTVKGSADEPVVFVERWLWTSTSMAESSSAKGDKVLAFLTRGEDGAYSVLDLLHGLKELSDSQLTTYLERISELAQIMEGGKPDPDDLVEWLVRCAEETATRWEGTYELNLSASIAFDSANSEEETTVDDKEDPEGDEEASEADAEPGINSATEAEEVGVDEEENLISSFAMLLTDSQKHRLVEALTKSDALEEGERLLIELASRWNDPRLVPFLFSHLQPAADGPPYLAEQIMEVVARVLGDKILTKLSEEYSELVLDTSESDGEQAAQADSAGSSNSTFISRKNAILERFRARAEKKLKR